MGMCPCAFSKKIEEIENENANLIIITANDPKDYKTPAKGLCEKGETEDRTKSGILYEDSKIHSKSAENGGVFDYYNHSTKSFDVLNHIRQYPEAYANFLDYLIENYEKNQNGKSEAPEIEIINNFEETLQDLSNYLLIHDDYWSIVKEIRDFLRIYAQSTDKKSELIEWNEKVYSICLHAVNDIEEKKDFKTLLGRKAIVQKISETLHFNSMCAEFILNGFYSPNIWIWHLLLENKERIRSIIQDNYLGGSVCCAQACTLVYLVNKSPKAVQILGVNPVNGIFQSLSLDEPIFAEIGYKNEITSGNYISNGESLIVTFNLFNGEAREETFYLS